MDTCRDPARGVAVAVGCLAAATGLAAGSGLDAFLTGLMLVGLAAVVVVLPFGILRGATVLRGSDERAAARIIGALAVLLTVATVVQYGLGSVLPATQIFALGGLTKMIVLPGAFLAFTAFAVFPPRPAERWNPLPAWWWILVGTLVLSCVFAAVMPRQSGSLKSLAEGTVLFLLFLACGVCGVQADRWSERLRCGLLDLLILAGLVSAMLQTLPQPFTALQTPAAAGAYLLALRGPRRRRVLYLLAALGLTASQVVGILGASSARPFSIASAAEIAVCVAILLCLALPLVVRKVVIAAGTITLVALAVRSGQLRLLLGGSDFDDVTIAHRGYETAMVIGALRQDAVTFLFGLGPAGTVDLTRSPDAATLAAAGRTLSTVDDVHLLSSHLMLKFGLGGLAWLAVFLVSVGFVTWRTMTAARPNWFDLSLLFYVVAGVTVAVPAATNLFANPLVPLCLGVLLQRLRARRGVDAVLHGGPTRLGSARTTPARPQEETCFSAPTSSAVDRIRVRASDGEQ